MYYTNKGDFVLSADGCMDTERGGLESILAGNGRRGRKGCCFSVAMSADGIAVLSSDGCAAAPDGTGCLSAITATRSCIRRRLADAG